MMRSGVSGFLSCMRGHLPPASLASFSTDATGGYPGGVPARIRAAMDQGPRRRYGERVCTHCPNGANVQKRVVRGTSTLLARGNVCGRPLVSCLGCILGWVISRRRNRPAVPLAVQPECHDQPALCGLRACLALFGL